MKFKSSGVIAAFLSLAACTQSAQAQNGNVGIGTATPGSKLTVSGSYAGTYNVITADRTLDATDYYTAYNVTAATGTITLPAYTAFTAPATGIGGRIYHIKNTGTGTLTVAANGAELLDNQSGAGVANISLPAGYYAMLVSKGTTTGTTWEVALVGSGGGSSTVNADNGLTVGYNTAGFVGLGGTLAKNTEVALNSKNFSLTGTGNVGIGTAAAAAPAAPLDIASKYKFYPSGTGSTTDPVLVLGINNNNWQRITTTSGATGALQFWGDGNGYTNNSPNLSINSNGRVGINHSNPGNRLEVNSGTAGASGMRFTQINSTTTAATTGTATLGVNSAGDVVVVPARGISGAFRVFNNSAQLYATGGAISAPPFPNETYDENNDFISNVFTASAASAGTWTFTGFAYGQPSSGGGANWIYYVQKSTDGGTVWTDIGVAYTGGTIVGPAILPLSVTTTEIVNAGDKIRMMIQTCVCSATVINFTQLSFNGTRLR